jgi:NADH-quinone oxidoreductase subunit E
MTQMTKMTFEENKLAEQGEEFKFTPENLEKAKATIAKYPEGRQASAVIALLYLAQKQNDGWLSKAAMNYVANLLDMAYIRVYELFILCLTCVL